MEKVSFLEDWNSVLFSGRNEIVFEGKNKHYGAYALRTGYSRAVIVATGLALSTGALLMTAAVIFGSQTTVYENKFIPDDGFVIMLPPPPVPPLPIEQPAVKPPASLAAKTTAYVPMVAIDEPILDPPLTQAQVSTKATAAVTTDGTDPVITTPPVNLAIENPGAIIENTTALEEQPSFPGGYAALMQFLKINMKYPPAELERQIEGKTFLSFIVNTDGTVMNVEVLKGITNGANLDAEAIRVIKIMPQLESRQTKWESSTCEVCTTHTI